MIYLLVGGLFFFNMGIDVNWAPWCWLEWSIAGILVLKLFQSKIPKIAVILFGYIVFQAITMTSFRPATDLTDMDKVSAIRLLASHALLELLLISGLFYSNWPKIRDSTAKAFIIFGFIHAIYLILDQIGIKLPSTFDSTLDTKGLLGNKSIGATFSIIWVFFLGHYLSNRKSNRIIIGIGLLATIVARSGISYFGFLVGSATMFRKSAWPHVLLVAGFFAGPLIKPTWFEHVARYDAWPMFYNFVNDKTNLIFGGGLGSFKYYGPTTQAANNFQIGRWWLWAHNDWLQILLELGWIGLILSFLTYLMLLKRSFNRPWLFAAISVYGVTMVGNYNLHVAPTALIGWWLAAEVVSND